MIEVYVVHLRDEDDGLYVFERMPDAQRFRDAAIRQGRDALLTAEPLFQSLIRIDALIEALAA